MTAAQKAIKIPLTTHPRIPNQKNFHTIKSHQPFPRNFVLGELRRESVAIRSLAAGGQNFPFQPFMVTRAINHGYRVEKKHMMEQGHASNCRRLGCFAGGLQGG